MIIYRPLTKPQALTFDLDDTLYDNWPIIRKAEQALLQFLQQHHPDIAKGGRSAWMTARSYCVAQDQRLSSDMTRLRKAVLTKLASDLGYSDSDKETLAEEGYEIFYHARSDFKINETVYSLLENLKQHCALVAITNGNVDLHRVGIAHLFDACFQASVQQPMKPHPHMFAAAIDHLDMPASQIMHVGDHLVKDIWGAHQVGMQTAWFAINRPMQLQSESARSLPSVVLNSLDELTELVG